ncbi:hypothetical protein ACQP1U_00440 [Actinomycetota bacterium]
MTRGVDWTTEENKVTVEAYLELLLAQFEERPMVKAEMNRRVQDQIDRTQGAIEFKFQNVSAVLQDLGHPFVTGYKPAQNYQDSLREAVLGGLSIHPVRWHMTRTT